MSGFLDGDSAPFDVVVIGGGIKSNTQIAATVRVRDVLEGPETAFGAKVVVNATGAWVDPVAETLTGRQPQAIRTTKGIHLVCKPLTQRALVLFSRLDRRLLFAILRAD